MRVHVGALVVAGALLLAAATARAGYECRATPLGLLCTHDENGDRVPERAFLFPTSEAATLRFDVEHRPGYNVVAIGTEAVPDARAAARYADYDGNADGAPEQRVLRAELILPSNVASIVVLTIGDGSSNGTPERIDYWQFSTHYGERSGTLATALP